MDAKENIITYARQLMNDDGSYDRAFNLFLFAFKRDLSSASLHEKDFCNLLLRLNSTLDESRTDIIFENFKKALRIYPNNTDLLNNVGIYLYKYGFYKEAREHFETVLNINPNHVNAEKNLNSIKNLLVERWHFRMLNDDRRNECYRRALSGAAAGARVLDAGSGSGLLALYARAAGAAAVLACDASRVMTRLAHQVMRTNNITDVHIINKMTTDLNICETGGKFTLLVTEMFDAGLFGEHVLQMLAHARPALLSHKARVIPSAAEFFVMGAHSEHLNRNYQLRSESKELLNIPFLNVHIMTDDESYDSEDVHLIEDVKYVTDPESVVKVNFNDLKNITDNLERTEPYPVNLIAKEDGVIDTVIGWFNLYLSDDITLTTDPTRSNRASAWQNAIFFGDLPFSVSKNETISLKFMMNGGKLTMAPRSNGVITRVSPVIMRFLNDTDYLKMISECVSMACLYLSRVEDISRVSVVDLCPFPMFGMSMLQRGARSLICCAQNEADKQFIAQVCAANGVAPSRVTIICGDDWSGDVFGDEKYHAIFTHALELGGDVDARSMALSARLRRRNLARGGLWLPARLRLAAQLVRSAWLRRNNRLADRSVRPYRIAAHLAAYHVTQNFSADLRALRCEPLSAPALLRRRRAVLPILAAGRADAIACWYSIRLMDESPEICTDRPNSFVDAMLFLTYSEQHLAAGEHANIVQLTDSDGCFKLIMEYS